MKWLLDQKWVSIGLGLVLVLIGIDSIASYQNAVELAQSAVKVKYTNEVLKSLIDIFASLTNAEMERREYILFRDESELKLYNTAVRSIPPQLKLLRQLLNDHPSQKARLLLLESLISQKLALLEHSNLYKGTTLSKDPLVAQIKRNRDEIRRVIDQMKNEEEQSLKLWIGRSQTSISYRMSIDFLDTLLTFAILCGLYILLYRQMVRRQQAEAIQQTLAQEKELSNLKFRFFSMVSHEFRTPLSIILGSAQLLTDNSQQWTAKQRKNLNRIQSSAQQMSHLLTDILTLERAEAGKLECRPEPLDIEAFCLNLIEDMQLGSETQHHIEFVSQGRCDRANLDEKLLYSIISNLLSNALKYSPPEKSVYFILSCSPEAVIFKIQDEGIGIPLENQQSLYKPFNRGANVGCITGTGLGLTVVKRCLDLHGGQISLLSKVGVGTAFTVKIPLQTRM